MPTRLDFALLSDLANYSDTPVCGNVSMGVRNVTACVNVTEVVNQSDAGGLVRYLGGNGAECEWDGGEWVDQDGEANCTAVRDSFYGYFDQNGTRCLNETGNETGYMDSAGGGCTGMWINATNASNTTRSYEACTTDRQEPFQEVCVTPPEPAVLAPNNLALTLMFINKPPSFRGRNLVVPGAEDPPLYNVSWLLESSPGTLANGSEAYDELWQVSPLLSTLNPEPSTLSPQPSTLSPEP